MKNKKRFFLLGVGFLALCVAAEAQQSLLKMEPVNFSHVTITDDFWKPKIDKVQRRKYQRKWIARNKDKLKNYYAKNREKLKQYYTDNRDHILSRVNGYYQKKKREMIEKVFEKHMDIKDGFMRR